MSSQITEGQVRSWIDDALVGDVESVPDQHAEFNLVVQMSGIMIHVIKQSSGGPLLVGQQLEFDDKIRNRIRDISHENRSKLLSQIRQALMQSDVIYGFRDQRDENVAFEEMHHVFLERRIYSDAATQQELMDSLVDVWKAMRYLDDMWELLESIDPSTFESS